MEAVAVRVEVVSDKERTAGFYQVIVVDRPTVITRIGGVACRMVLEPGDYTMIMASVPFDGVSVPDCRVEWVEQ